MVWSRLAHALAFRALATFHCGEMRQAETMLQRAEQLLVKRNYPISYVGLVKAVRSAFFWHKMDDMKRHKLCFKVRVPHPKLLNHNGINRLSADTSPADQTTRQASPPQEV